MAHSSPHCTNFPNDSCLLNLKRSLPAVSLENQKPCIFLELCPVTAQEVIHLAYLLLSEARVCCLSYLSSLLGIAALPCFLHFCLRALATPEINVKCFTQAAPRVKGSYDFGGSMKLLGPFGFSIDNPCESSHAGLQGKLCESIRFHGQSFCRS